MKPLRLMDIPNKSKLVVETENGPKKAWFDHPDGMYSYCYLDEDHSQVFHLNLGCPMKKVDDHYEIANTPDEADSI